MRRSLQCLRIMSHSAFLKRKAKGLAAAATECFLNFGGNVTIFFPHGEASMGSFIFIW